MLKKLTCQNWQQHRDRVVNFTGGFNVILGENEAGKSALIRAICYALWGSRALPDSLEDYVTWGETLGSMRVELEFSIRDVDYVIVRKKSGAELHGGGMSVYGQAEVTTTVDSLFKAPYQTAFSTIIASQGDLKSILDGSAMQLIENLSGMQLIDELVKAVQDTLPCGNTKAVDAQIVGEDALLLPVADYSDADHAVLVAEATHTAAANAVLAARTAADTLEEAAKTARNTLAEQATYATALARQIAQRQAAASEAVPPTLLPVEDVSGLAEAQMAQAAAVARHTAYRKFANLDFSMWYAGGAQEFAEAGRKLIAENRERKAKDMALHTEATRADAMRITQSACGLCGKDLQDVPEVVSKNAELDARIAEISQQRAELKREIDAVNARLLELKQFDDRHTLNSQAIESLGSYVKLVAEHFPAKAEWVGEVPPAELPAPVDYAGRISAATRARNTNSERESRYRTAVARVNDLDAAIAETKAKQVDTVESERIIESEQIAKDMLKSCLSEQGLTAHALQMAKNARTVLEVQHNSAVNQVQEARLRNQRLIAVRDEMVGNNELIGKLRAARPIVASQLWGTMLSGISALFSSMRGQASIVTRSGNTFLIDGKKASVYSGSTKDILGLAIRVMLQKTFLGGTPFLILDEPAAACSDNREAELLAAVAAAGYEQVLVVTHSDVADTFASNVINI